MFKKVYAKFTAFRILPAICGSRNVGTTKNVPAAPDVQLGKNVVDVILDRAGADRE